MQRYRDFRPTRWDYPGAILTNRQDWFVAPVGQNRDSGPLDRSNFRVELARLGGESKTVEVHRFGHWACGWFEIILVHPSLEKAVTDIARALDNYPILDEMDLAMLELEEGAEVL